MKENNFLKIMLLCFFLLATQVSFSQKDTLVMKSNEKVMGEIKKFDNGVIQIETAFSDKDFQVEYDKVIFIYIRLVIFWSLQLREIVITEALNQKGMIFRRL